eukprot:1084054-Prorocentrum_minimum.AAC.1
MYTFGSPTLYTGASCGTWISPRSQYVAHGACSWESRMFTTLVTPHFGRVCPSCTVQHTLKMPLVRGTVAAERGRRLRAALPHAKSKAREARVQ